MGLGERIAAKRGEAIEVASEGVALDIESLCLEMLVYQAGYAFFSFLAP